MPFELPHALGVLLPLAVLLVLLALSRTLLRGAIALVFGRRVGEAALARQPDAIHLHPAGAEPWREPAAPVSLVTALRSLGFRDAGTHGIGEMPGLAMQLLAHESGDAWAAVYEHPRAGVWFDLYAHGTAGGAFTVTSNAPTGLDAAPDRPVVHAAGASPAEAWERFRRERPAGSWLPATPEDAVPAFERAWAENIAWRRRHGISRREVLRVAHRRAA